MASRFSSITIRIVFVPKSRNVDPELLKESLFKLTDLETRFGLNLNVLDDRRTPDECRLCAVGQLVPAGHVRSGIYRRSQPGIGDAVLRVVHLCARRRRRGRGGAALVHGPGLVRARHAIGPGDALRNHRRRVRLDGHRAA
jgi:hypothetical protein